MDTFFEAAMTAWRELIRISGALRRDLNAMFSAAGISGSQYGILSQLDVNGSMPLGELGKRLWVSCGDVTGLIDKLVAAGYVRRIRQHSDRRVVLAEITEEGRNLLHQLRPKHREHILLFMGGLQEHEMYDLRNLLQKMCCKSAASVESEEER